MANHSEQSFNVKSLSLVSHKFFMFLVKDTSVYIRNRSGALRVVGTTNDTIDWRFSLKSTLIITQNQGVINKKLEVELA